MTFVARAFPTSLTAQATRLEIPLACLRYKCTHRRRRPGCEARRKLDLGMRQHRALGGNKRRRSKRTVFSPRRPEDGSRGRDAAGCRQARASGRRAASHEGSGLRNRRRRRQSGAGGRAPLLYPRQRPGRRRDRGGLQKDFPKINGTYLRAQNEALYRKLLAERSAGRFAVDVVQSQNSRRRSTSRGRTDTTFTTRRKPRPIRRTPSAVPKAITSTPGSTSSASPIIPKEYRLLMLRRSGRTCWTRNGGMPSARSNRPAGCNSCNGTNFASCTARASEGFRRAAPTLLRFARADL